MLTQLYTVPRYSHANLTVSCTTYPLPLSLPPQASLKDEVMPPEVDQMMAALNAPSSLGAKRAPQASSRQMMKSSIVDDSKVR